MKIVVGRRLGSEPITKYRKLSETHILNPENTRSVKEVTSQKDTSFLALSERKYTEIDRAFSVNGRSLSTRNFRV